MAFYQEEANKKYKLATKYFNVAKKKFLHKLNKKQEEVSELINEEIW